MLRASDRLAVRVAEGPELAALDEAPQLTLGEPTSRTTRAPHFPGGHLRPPHGAPLIAVLDPAHRITNALPTNRRAEPLMPHARQKLTTTQLAEPRPRRDPLRLLHRRTPTPQTAQHLIPCRGRKSCPQRRHER